MPRDRLDPKEVSAWERIIRDAVVVVVGAFMLLYETVFVTTPNALIIGAGLLALGLPPALRVDEIIRNRNGEK